MSEIISKVEALPSAETTAYNRGFDPDCRFDKQLVEREHSSTKHELYKIDPDIRARDIAFKGFTNIEPIADIQKAETATEVVDNTQMDHHVQFPEETAIGSNISFGSRELSDCKWEIDKLEREMRFETGEKYEKLKKMRDELRKTAEEYVRSDGYAKHNMFNATWNAAHRK